MAYPVIQATNTSKTNGATSHTVNLPASIVAGELLVFFFTCDSGSTITTPSGWTSVKDSTNAQRRLAMFTKTATGSEGATVSVTTSGTTDSAHTSYRVSTNNYTVTVSSGATATDTTPDPDTLTNGASGKYLWFAVCCSSTSVTGYPSNYNTNTTTNIQDAFSIGVGTRSTETDNQNPGSFTTSGSGAWLAFTASLAPQTPYIGSFSLITMASGIFTIGISYGATATTTLLTMASQIFTPVAEVFQTTKWTKINKS